MVMTNISVSGAASLLTGSGTIPQFCAIGTGSVAENSAIGSLVTEALSDRKSYTSRDASVSSEVTWAYDWSSIEMSGTTLSEFGVGTGSGINVQDLWNREGFAGTEFDGSNELQISVTYKYFL